VVTVFEYPRTRVAKDAVANADNQTMSGSTDKLRGLFLAAIMVLSVVGGTVAMSGTAAAANAAPASAVEYQTTGTAVDSSTVQGGDFEVTTTAPATVTDAELFVDGASQGNVSVGATGQRFTIGDGAYNYGDIKPSEDATLKLRWTDPDGTDAEVANVSVTVTAQNLGANQDTFAYQGAPVAYVASETDVAFDINRGSSFFANRSTGPNSEVFVFDTAGLSTDVTWYFNDSSSSTAFNDASLNLRNLGLAVTADDTSLTTNDRITGTIEARQSNRAVDVALLNDGDVVSETTATIDGDGVFILDLVLFPDVAVQSTGNTTVEPDSFNYWEPVDQSLPYLSMASILLLVWALYYSKVLYERDKPSKDKPSRDSSEDLEEDAQEVLSFIQAEQRLTQKRIREEFHYSQSKISLILTDLEDRGLIRKIKRGRGNVIVAD